MNRKFICRGLKREFEAAIVKNNNGTYTVTFDRYADIDFLRKVVNFTREFFEAEQMAERSRKQRDKTGVSSVNIFDEERTARAAIDKKFHDAAVEAFKRPTPLIKTGTGYAIPAGFQH